MNQSLSDYQPPSFQPVSRDLRAFRDEITAYLRDRFAQYHVAFIKSMVQVANTGTQAFGLDLVAQDTIAPTNWAHRISGGGTINTITPPNGFQSFIVLLSLAGFTFGTTGNIQSPGLVAINTLAICVFDPIAQTWWVQKHT